MAAPRRTEFLQVADHGGMQGGSWAEGTPRRRATLAPSREGLVAAVVCALVTALVVVLGYAAVHEAALAHDAQRRLADAQRSTATAERAKGRMFQAVPGSRTVSDYGAPYNVRVVCTVSGSVGGRNESRRPLDLTSKPRPGDVYVKTCRGYHRPAKSSAKAATGQPST